MSRNTNDETSFDSLIHRLSRLANRQPDKTFVHIVSSDGESSLSYAALLAESYRYADYYRQNGLNKGDIVLLMLRYGIENYPAFVGAMLAGVVPTFMPMPGPKQPPEVYWPIHRELVDRRAVKAVLTHADHASEMDKHMPGMSLSILHLEALARQGQEPSAATRPAVRSDDLAFIQHSSGTTGVKKGIGLSHQVVLDQIDAYAELLDFDDNDCIASWLPLYHDMGLITSFLMPMAKGASVVSCSPFEWLLKPDIWLDAASRYGCSHAWMPNFAFSHLAKVVRADPAWDLSSLRWINCSEPCKASSFSMFCERFSGVGVTEKSFSVCYAMAENVFAVSQTKAGIMPRNMPRPSEGAAVLSGWQADRATADSSDVLSCGPAMPGVEIRILHEDGRPLPEGQVGEIAIRGPFLFSGYHEDPVSTAERLRDGWFLTHDLGFLDAGELFVTGRVDDLINLYGRKIYAHDVEFAVNAQAGVIPGRCVAIGHASEETGSQELIVLAETEPDIETAVLKRAIKIKIEAEIGVTAGKVELFGKGWLIKTTSGKISRYLNYQKYIEMRGQA